MLCLISLAWKTRGLWRTAIFFYLLDLWFPSPYITNQILYIGIISQWKVILSAWKTSPAGIGPKWPKIQINMPKGAHYNGILKFQCIGPVTLLNSCRQHVAHWIIPVCLWWKRCHFKPRGQQTDAAVGSSSKTLSPNFFRAAGWSCTVTRKLALTYIYVDDKTSEKEILFMAFLLNQVHCSCSSLIRHLKREGFVCQWSYFWLPTVTFLPRLHKAVPTALALHELLHVRHIEEAHAAPLLEIAVQVPFATLTEDTWEGVAEGWTHLYVNIKDGDY